MWCYEMGSEADFEGASSACWAVVRDKASGIVVQVAGDLPGDADSRVILAHRRWVTDEGWIDWPGGACPLPGGEVDVRLRSGRFIFRRHAPSIGANWRHDGGRKDIVAYRVRPEPVRTGNDDTPIPF